MNARNLERSALTGFSEAEEIGAKTMYEARSGRVAHWESFQLRQQVRFIAAFVAVEGRT